MHSNLRLQLESSSPVIKSMVRCLLTANVVQLRKKTSHMHISSSHISSHIFFSTHIVWFYFCTVFSNIYSPMMYGRIEWFHTQLDDCWFIFSKINPLVFGHHFTYRCSVQSIYQVNGDMLTIYNKTGLSDIRKQLGKGKVKTKLCSPLGDLHRPATNTKNILLLLFLL